MIPRPRNTTIPTTHDINAVNTLSSLKPSPRLARAENLPNTQDLQAFTSDRNPLIIF
jgi:hypothetical protein